MPFIPHTEDEIKQMLKSIGVTSIEQLFDEIPCQLRHDRLDNVPLRMSEMDITRLMRERAQLDNASLCFLGAGAYEHHIPAAVWELTTRGEYYTAYTPYQAEASQGTLQLLYEFQTMMTQLTAMDVANASLYDGATALAEAVLMAIRANRKSKSKRILIPHSTHPVYRKVVHSIVKNQGIQLEEIDFDIQGGAINLDALPQNPGDFAALIIQQPNFFGVLEEMDDLTDWAHKHNALVIASVNPTSLALLQPPGQWGSNGADIACGEGQPLGIPLSSGGPYFGFMCCKQAYVRQMPGRIIGKTTDLDGKDGYTLTLQAREQHIRRSKATSNICTNQGLMTTAATIYMSLLGPAGLETIAANSHNNTKLLLEQLTAIDGIDAVFDRPFFHETAVRFTKPETEIIEQLAKHGILAGYSLSKDYPELGNALLICATETKTAQDLQRFCDALNKALT
ncbi:MAG: aminomethyl-transferring glycine dehydrogenase subunit GcvPA [Gammaproteobacteria bacterium]|nr:aminomethyl-transferring glycine dehydrogenase subunit GcvPA [Gammaproteobacteria bacterium]